MAGTMLFCTSKNSKAVTRGILDVDTEEVPPGHFWLIETRNGPPLGERFRKRLSDNADFSSDFVDASEQECQRWALERQSHDNLVNQNIIVIVDARSAKDQTVLLQKFNERPDGMEDFNFGDYGILPAERNVWYSFRVEYQNVPAMVAALTETSPEVTYPIYYGNKEHFTNEYGVFDVREADRYCNAVDQDVLESDIIRRKFM